MEGVRVCVKGESFPDWPGGKAGVLAALEGAGAIVLTRPANASLGVTVKYAVVSPQWATSKAGATWVALAEGAGVTMLTPNDPLLASPPGDASAAPPAAAEDPVAAVAGAAVGTKRSDRMWTRTTTGRAKPSVKARTGHVSSDSDGGADEESSGDDDEDSEWEQEEEGDEESVVYEPAYAPRGGRRGHGVPSAGGGRGPAPKRSRHADVDDGDEGAGGGDSPAPAAATETQVVIVQYLDTGLSERLRVPVSATFGSLRSIITKRHGLTGAGRVQVRWHGRQPANGEGLRECKVRADTPIAVKLLGEGHGMGGRVPDVTGVVVTGVAPPGGVAGSVVVVDDSVAGRGTPVPAPAPAPKPPVAEVEVVEEMVVSLVDADTGARSTITVPATATFGTLRSAIARKHGMSGTARVKLYSGGGAEVANGHKLTSYGGSEASPIKVRLMADGGAGGGGGGGGGGAAGGAEVGDNGYMHVAAPVHRASGISDAALGGRYYSGTPAWRSLGYGGDPLPDPLPGDVRIVPWSAYASADVSARVQRALTQRMFLVDRRQLTGSQFGYEFSVLGSTGNLYKVRDPQRGGGFQPRDRGGIRAPSSRQGRQPGVGCARPLPLPPRADSQLSLPRPPPPTTTWPRPCRSPSPTATAAPAPT
jgi:hypothetical protein